MSNLFYIFDFMNVFGIDINWPMLSKNSSGDFFYDLRSADDWASGKSNIKMAQDHPILTPALLFVSKLFSQAQIDVYDKNSNVKLPNHPLKNILSNPNWFQTLPDLFESLLFTQIATGVGVIFLKRTLGVGDINAMYVLDYNKIKFPDSVKKNVFRNGAASEKALEQEVVYDPSGENLKIKLKDLLFFYDLPNAISSNPFKAESRIAGLRQTLINTQDSLTAKNIILKSNGKELISGNKDGFPLDNDEKKDAEGLFNNKYGLSSNRKRGLITKANIKWQSLHIALRDLGLDESIKIDGNLIYTALHIPKDILSLEAKKTTYNNFKESMVSYVQNEMQPTLNSFCAVLNKVIEGEGELRGTFEHLPIMQYILLERYNGVKKQTEALILMRKAGIPDKVALKHSGFDEDMELGPLVENTENNGTSQGDQSEEDPTTSTETEEETKIRNLIERSEN